MAKFLKEGEATNLKLYKFAETLILILMIEKQLKGRFRHMHNVKI